MNQTLETITSRRSCRKFLQKQITDDELNTVLEAGLHAPSGMGAQSPILIAVQDPTVIAELNKINMEIRGSTADQFFSAPTVVVVLANPNICYTYERDGMATVMNMLLAAESIGLGATCISRAKAEFETPYCQDLLQKLGVDSTYVGIEHVILGYRDGEAPAAKPRHDNRIYRV